MKKSKKEYHNLIQHELNLNPIKRFFVFSSGANLNILKYCPEEINKYASIGATIFLTALLASLSGGYAFNFAFNNVILSSIFGIFWGIIIFNLDRYIVMSIRKNKSEKISTILNERDPKRKKSLLFDKLSNSINTILMALPRIIIAIIIALTVSKPIELRLFKNTIEKELSNIENKDIAAYELQYKNEINELNNKILELNKKENSEKELVYRKNPIYNKKVNRKIKLENEITTLEQKIKNNKEIISKHKFLKTGYRSVTKYYTDGTPYISQEPYKYWVYDKVAKNKINENKSLSKKIASNNKEIETLNKDIKEIEKGFDISIKKISDNYDQLRKPIIEQIQNKKNSYSSDLAEWKNKTKSSKDILSRLQALGNITEKKNSDGSHNSAYWASFLITMLFISLETAPVIVKLLTKRGPYDDLLDRIEYEYFINQQEAISKLNSKVNTILEKIKKISKLEGKLFIKVEKQRLDAELKNNEKILDEIAKKQEHLAKLSIEEWYQKELKKFENNNNE